MSAEEIIDIVDENDRVVGQSPRGEAYERGLRHRCAFILARDAEGRIFVHRRTPAKLVFPSCTTCSSAVSSARARATTRRRCGRRRRSWG
ncbi:hypothetical protein SHKM778_65530 [Streptomyces sp. KM77-8]|uniref:NUDIX domain-containing protein n=1 Tax=Streptomyces haneummycinicus TaxID=3074435 RepID=A0AAT9HRP7_9ACTN